MNDPSLRNEEVLMRRTTAVGTALGLFMLAVASSAAQGTGPTSVQPSDVAEVRAAMDMFLEVRCIRDVYGNCVG